MIFKQRICDKEGKRDGWQYIDGISECWTFYDKEHGCMCIDITKDKECILAIHSEAYLLNDDGKTIERISVGGLYGEAPKPVSEGKE